MWSIGVILYLSLTGLLPFYGDSTQELIYKINKGWNNSCDCNDITWNSLTTEIKDLIVKLLDRDPNKRPTAEECLSHPWFKKIEEMMQSDEEEEVKKPVISIKNKIMSNINIVQKQIKMQKVAMKWIIRE